MSYSESIDGKIILSLSKEDYDLLERCLLALTVSVCKEPGQFPMIETVNVIADLAERLGMREQFRREG